jgi:hypothetical protein
MTTADGSIPPGRGRWRLTLHKRQFADQGWAQTQIGLLDSARNRKLVQAWDMPATLTFDIDGRAPDATTVQELAHDVIAWRWDEISGTDIPVFRGMVEASDDQIDESSHVVTFTCHDYLAMLNRRVYTGIGTDYMGSGTPPVFDQDYAADQWRQWAGAPFSTYPIPGQHGFSPGSYLPLYTFHANGNGSQRTPPTGVSRTVPQQGNMVVLTQLDALAKMSNGFDYDVKPLCMNANASAQVAVNSATRDAMRIFYPSQGVTQSGITLAYGSSISKVQRQVTAADYTNYWRTIGNNGNADNSATQVIGENWNSDATATVVGTFMTADSASVTSTDTGWLNAVAAGNVGNYGVLNPTYVLTLTPNFYTWGLFNMGDTVPVVIQSGRLNVTTAQRILGITYDIGDDGQEDVEIVVARATTTLGGMLRTQSQAINALSRR